jgi:hypothetical protein
MALRVSTLGSSLNSPETMGLAPMRSPAATVSVLRVPVRRPVRVCDRYAAPPNAVVPCPGSVELPPVGASRFPW